MCSVFFCFFSPTLRSYNEAGSIPAGCFPNAGQEASTKAVARGVWAGGGGGHRGRYSSGLMSCSRIDIGTRSQTSASRIQSLLTFHLRRDSKWAIAYLSAVRVNAWPKKTAGLDNNRNSWGLREDHHRVMTIKVSRTRLSITLCDPGESWSGTLKGRDWPKFFFQFFYRRLLNKKHGLPPKWTS